MNPHLLTKFLKSFKEECKKDAEYLPAADWNLFYFLKENTELTLLVINKIKDDPDFELDWIFQQFSNPMSVGINIKQTYNLIEEINPRTRIQERILGNLKNAIPNEK